MPLTPVQSGQLNPGSSTFFGSSCVAGTGSVTGTNGIFIPFSALESYKTATSGDIRELLYSVVDKIFSGLTAMNLNSGANKVNMSRSVSFLDADSVRKSFSIVTDLNVTGMVYDVKDEA